MYQFKGLEDTIVAIATATGPGGIGIVRLSGHQSIEIANSVFKAKNGKSLNDQKSFSTAFGWIVSEDEVVDEVLVTIMRNPKSYTKEDVVEISCHGGVVAVRSTLNLILNQGARLAEPGEFTKRAFLNGRIDLAQAEAVLDVINSKTDTFLRVSTHQLKGELSDELNRIREQLMATYVQLEAIINFPEDDIDPQTRVQIAETIKNTGNGVGQLLASSENGRILKEGIRIVLCGKPNVGKSSLLNVLLKQQRAIVTEVEGTTRDVLEETAQINGIPFQLVDTAGILEPRDLVEEEAVKRSHLYIESADLILLVIDQSRSLEDQDIELMDKIKHKNICVVLNKSDLDSVVDVDQIQNKFSKATIINVSALEKNGIQDLEQAIIESVWHGDHIDTHALMVSNLRHINALKDAEQALHSASKNLDDDESFEFISEEVKRAVNQLDAITGRNIDQDLIDQIFSEFCIGK